MTVVAGPGWLFCPADRPERFEKAAAAADVVILDLEDGVAAKDRPAARQALVDSPLDPSRTVVRVNPSDTEDHQRDLEALASTAYTTVMLAKTETPEQISALSPATSSSSSRRPWRRCASSSWPASTTPTR